MVPRPYSDVYPRSGTPDARARPSCAPHVATGGSAAARRVPWGASANTSLPPARSAAAKRVPWRASANTSLPPARTGGDPAPWEARKRQEGPGRGQAKPGDTRGGHETPGEVVTVMLKNLPNKCTRDMLLPVLDADHQGEYDFVYFPIDFKQQCNQDYCFINFRSPQACHHFTVDFHGVAASRWEPMSDRNNVFEVLPAKIQGRRENIEQIGHSSWFKDIADRPEWLPLLFDKLGDPEAFPLHEFVGSPDEAGSKGAKRKLDAPWTANVGSPDEAGSKGAKRKSGAETRKAKKQARMSQEVVNEGAAAPSPELFDDDKINGEIGHPPAPAFAEGVHGREARDPTATESGALTTVFLRGLHAESTRDTLVDFLNDGFRSLFDFVYVPRDFRTGQNLGHGMINFVETDFAQEFMTAVQGSSPSIFDGAGQVSWSDKCHGRQSLVEHYRNSAVMHSSVPEGFQPVLYEYGKRISMPAPTQTIRGPKKRAKKSNGEGAPEGDDIVDSVQADPGDAAPDREGTLTAENTNDLAAGTEARTTVLVCNLRESCLRDEVVDFLNSQGINSLYDFVYVPKNFRDGHCMGYALVNFIGPDVAQEFMDSVGEVSGTIFSEDCKLTWSDKGHGFQHWVKHYRNSSVMHPSVPEEAQPIIFEHGERVAFPSPTEAVRHPKRKNGGGKAGPNPLEEIAETKRRKGGDKAETNAPPPWKVGPSADSNRNWASRQGGAQSRKAAPWR